MPDLSIFARTLGAASGISRLMDDLGKTLAQTGDTIMLGGGNPAHIPDVQACFRENMRHIIDSPASFATAFGNYDPPQGNSLFIELMSSLLRQQFSWQIGADNIALTNGSQTAFFSLFNMLAGTGPGGQKKRILLPLTPEYIGYADLGLEPDLFVSLKPDVELLGEHRFKYHIDFDLVQEKLGQNIGAICVSRPTNPTGNVITNDEMNYLGTLAKEAGIPLIIDNAYGQPFPDIIYTDAAPIWDENTIMCMSLSKLGLPATRTGIVVAQADIVQTTARMNAVMGLAPGGIGPCLATQLIRRGDLLPLCRDLIRPYYSQRLAFTEERLAHALAGLDYRIHVPEGAFFIWLWMPKLPISSIDLYERLKQNGVIVVPGEYFFPGIDPAWAHTRECIRISYAQELDVLERGIDIIAQEIRSVYGTTR
jgi:valine--pyruvate aminotransferase